MVCTVLPSPISSARMVSVPWAQEKRSQLRPSSWYGCSVPPVESMYQGCLSNLTVGYRGGERSRYSLNLGHKSPAPGLAHTIPLPGILSSLLSSLPTHASFRSWLEHSQSGLGVPMSSCGRPVHFQLGGFLIVGFSDFEPRLQSPYLSCSPLPPKPYMVPGTWWTLGQHLFGACLSASFP